MIFVKNDRPSVFEAGGLRVQFVVLTKTSCVLSPVCFDTQFCTAGFLLIGRKKF